MANLDITQQRVEALLQRIADSLDRAEAKRAEPDENDALFKANAERYSHMLDRMEAQLDRIEEENRPLKFGEKGGGE